MKKINEYIKNNIISIGLIGLIVALYMIFNDRQIIDYDYWFHYRLGEYIYQNKEVPELAIGSWYAIENGLPWISHEWAFGLLIYLLSFFKGENLAQLFAIFFNLGIILLVLWINRQWYFKRPAITVLVAFSLCLCSVGITVPRPQLIAYALSIALVIIIRKAFNENKPKIYLWLLPLTLIWVNFHGGSYFLIVLALICVLICKCSTFNIGVIEFKKVSNRELLYYLSLIVGVLLTACVNPHGVSMIAYPLVNMGDSVMIKSIAEWQPLNINDIYQLLVFVFPIITLCCLIANKKKNSIDIALFFMFFLLTIKSMRFIYQLNLISALMLPTFASFTRTYPIKGINRLALILSLILGTIIGSTAGFSGVFQHYQKGDFYNQDTLLSDEMINKIKELRPTHLYNQYNYGGQLMYEHIDTWIDGRADVFSKYTLEDEVQFSKGVKDVEDMIKKYKFDAMVFAKNLPLYQQMILLDQLHPDRYEVIYEDERNVLYTIHEGAE